MRTDDAWDQDPARDPVVQRALRSVAPQVLADSDAGRLEAAIMTAVRRGVKDGITAAWWEVAARWAPAAAAAGIAAVLLSGAVIFGAMRSGASTEEETAPETAAVAQVIDRYPGDAVLASLISGNQPDALSPWGER
jgi:hypothetical protein